LVRAIGRFDLTAAVVNGVIGSAIFGMPAAQAALTGAWSPLAYMLAGLPVLVIMLCFAEVASRFRDAGGPYLYGREAFGPFVGFQAGWLTFWIRVTAGAANLNVFVSYLSQLAPAAAAPFARASVMAGLVAVVTIINLLGVRQATWTVNGFTLAKLLPLVLLAVIGLPAVTGPVLASQAVTRPDWMQAVLLLMFAYGGFEAPLIPAGEARDPRRDSAFALLAALAVVATVYMAVQFVVVGIVPEVARVEAPVAAAFGRLWGPFGVAVASVGAMVSIWGYTTGNALQTPRLLYAMAERRELPAMVSHLSARRAPHVAICLFAACLLSFALLGSFAWNAALSAVVRLVTYGLTCAAVVVLRRRQPAEEPGFRLPAGPLLSAVGTLFCAGLLYSRARSESWTLVAILGLFVGLGAVVFTARPAGAGVPARPAAE
jgi:amino acid transporter